jgi:hypothetical protein
MQTFIRGVALVVTLLATSSASAQTPTLIGPGGVLYQLVERAASQ